MKKYSFTVLATALLLAVVAIILIPTLHIQIAPPDEAKYHIIDGIPTVRIGFSSSVEAAPVLDYTTTGTADDTQFQAALNALPSSGGKIEAMAGTYTFDATVSRAINNVVICGQGNATVFNHDASTPLFSAGSQTNWVFRDFRTDAGGITLTSATNYRLDNVTLGATFYPSSVRSATYVIATSDATIQEKSQADAVLPGAADDVIINAALTTYNKVAIIGNDISTSGTINMTDFQTLDCAHQTCLNYTGSGSAFHLSGNNIFLNLGVLISVNHTADYGITFHTMQQSKVSADQIGILPDHYFKTACLYGSAEGNGADNVFDCIMCGGGQYGIKLDSQNGVVQEGNWFNFQAIYGVTVCSVLVGSTTSYQSNHWDTFNVGCDAAGVTPLLIQCYDPINTFNLWPWTQATGDYDILIESSALNTIVNEASTSYNGSTAIYHPRIVNRCSTTALDFPGVFTTYKTNFDSIDGFATSVSGSGAVTLDSSNGYLQLTTGASGSSAADIFKRIAYPIIANSWAVYQKFKTNIYFSANTNQTIYVTMGYRDTSEHVGFKIVNNTIYASRADGATQTTNTTGITINAASSHVLEAIYSYNGAEANFFVDGVLTNTVTTNLPTSANFNNLPLYVFVQNAAAETKTIVLSDWEYMRSKY